LPSALLRTYGNIIEILHPDDIRLGSLRFYVGFIDDGDITDGVPFIRVLDYGFEFLLRRF
jgi:hypothetical protein